MRQRYLILSGKECTNDCVICTTRRPPFPQTYHIGRTPVEKRALERLAEATEHDEVTITGGGDPLRHPELLEAIATNAKGYKNLVINPISFLSEQTGKPGRRITATDFEQAMTEKPNKGVERLVTSALRFNRIFLSDGILQAPSETIHTYARAYYHHITERYFLVQSKVVSCARNNLFDIKFSHTLSNVSPLRKNARKSSDIKSTSSCHMNPFHRNLFFLKEGTDARLFFLMCCQAELTKYTTFPTAITSNEMAEMTGPQLREKIETAHRRFRESASWWFLNMDCANEDNSDERSRRFISYLATAERLLAERGMRLGIDEASLSFREGNGQCSHCNTAGYLLHKAGVSVAEWHTYLEQKYAQKNEQRGGA